MPRTPSLSRRFRDACDRTPLPSPQSPRQQLARLLQHAPPHDRLPPPDPPSPSSSAHHPPPLEPMAQLSSLTWANSRSRQVLRAFVDDCLSLHPHQHQPHTPVQPSASSPPSPPPLDPMLWAAQEHAAASAVLRHVRALHARRKSTPPLLAARRLKPEAAAEMARARVAAAAAAAVMKHHPTSSTVLTSADTPQAARPRFRRSLSQTARHKKHVHFADDTVFNPPSNNRLP